MTTSETIAYAIKKECSTFSLVDWCKEWDFSVEQFNKFLQAGVEAGSTEQAQKTGKFERKIIPSSLGYYEYECSECGHSWQYREVLNWNYCPNCGARMEREEE